MSKSVFLVRIIIAICFFHVKVIGEMLVILVLCSCDHIGMCTFDTRVVSHLFGLPRRVSVFIPRARLPLFDWSKLLFRSNEQRADWLLVHCVTPLKQVFYLRFLPDSDTCRITKQRGPRSSAVGFSASVLHCLSVIFHKYFSQRGTYDMHRSVMLLAMGSFRSDDKK